MISVSVIISSYNKAQYIARAINSVLCQKYLDFEIICLDAGSSDGSREILSEIRDSRFRLYQVCNNGISAAKNLGVVLATKKFVTFLDADDYWEPNFLSEINNLSEDYAGCQAYCTGYYRIAKSNKFPIQYHSGGLIELHDYLYFRTNGWGLHTSSFVIRKNSFNEYGGFPVNLFTRDGNKSWLVDCNGLILASYDGYFWSGKSAKVTDEIKIPHVLRKYADLRIEVPGCGGEDQFLHDNAIFKGKVAYSRGLLSNWSCDVPGQDSTLVHSLVYPTLIVIGLNISKLNIVYKRLIETYYFYQLVTPFKEILVYGKVKNIAILLTGNKFFDSVSAFNKITFPISFLSYYLLFKFRKFKYKMNFGRSD